MRGTVEIAWRQRQTALVPTAALTRGAAGRRLARRLLAADDHALARLRGLIAAGDLLVIGTEPTDLPWVDGTRYFGRDPRAPGPLWPTDLEPAVPPALVARALQRRCPGPFVVVPPTHERAPQLVPLAEARAIDKAALTAWLGPGKADPP